jgi:choline-sulfatase
MKQSTKAPNFLFIMVDQMAAPTLPIYGHPLVKAPHIQTLAEGGVVFDSAYCASPLCGPARFSLFAGQLPSRIGAYDNAAEFPATIPTFLHYLRAMGYRTCISGKQHFVGPDQLHGAEERLTSDIYPADFGWTPNWADTNEALSWHHNMLSVVEADPCQRDLQIDFDDEMAYQSVRKIYDLARDNDPRPFFLMASFTHPHDPYNITPEYWNRYDHEAIDLPSVPSIPYQERDPHSQRLYNNYKMDDYPLTEEQVRNARHAYYGAISYVDDKIGELLRALEDTGLADNTVIIFTGDHGDMLGERGMWYKMSFFEWSARVPLIIHAPNRFAPGRVARNVSHLDLLPTLIELAANGAGPQLAEPIEGSSLIALMEGRESGWSDTVYGEYLAEGSIAPILMVRHGHYKYIYCESDPTQLYDLMTDPQELNNLAGRPEYQELEKVMAAKLEARWSLKDRTTLTEQVILSQKRRRLVSAALLNGRHTAWDFEPRLNEARRYVRNESATLGDIERQARLPRSAALLTDKDIGRAA